MQQTWLLFVLRVLFFSPGIIRHKAALGYYRLSATPARPVGLAARERSRRSDSFKLAILPLAVWQTGAETIADSQIDLLQIHSLQTRALWESVFSPLQISWCRSFDRSVEFLFEDELLFEDS